MLLPADPVLDRTLTCKSRVPMCPTAKAYYMGPGIIANTTKQVPPSTRDTVLYSVRVTAINGGFVQPCPSSHWEGLVTVGLPPSLLLHKCKYLPSNQDFDKACPERVKIPPRVITLPSLLGVGYMVYYHRQ